MNDRYSRQLLFSPIGEKGQLLIGRKHVLMIGAGALGSRNAEVLVRSGVGKLTIIDRDYVEASNLQRQQLYTEEDVKEKLPKAIAAKKRLMAINSEVEVVAIVADAVPSLLEDLVSEVDLILDATDNFETRMLLNDISQKHHIPWIYGACVGSFGMSLTIIPGVTPCLYCLLKKIPIQGMTCDTGGIIAPAVQMVIAHQTAEALKILVGDLDAIRTTFTSFDMWRNQYSNIKVAKIKDTGCLSCGEAPTYPFLQQENLTKTTVLCGRDTVQVRPSTAQQLDLQRLSQQMKVSGYDTKGNPYLLSIDLKPERVVIFQDGRALIHGTKDLAQARSIYQKLLG